MVQTSLAFHLEGDTHADYPTDLLAFLIVVYLAIRWNVYRGQMPGGLFRTIVRDATHYFLVIFTSHVALEMTLLFARVSILSCRSIFPLSPAETLLALNAGAPFHVSDTRIYLLHLFTRSFSVKQWNHCVRLNIYFVPKRCGLNGLLGMFR